ncbi:MAG: hypothetical protein AAGE52_11730 [Myxococcota bacterium]
MTSDEARELFSEAYDGVLSAEEQSAFDAALAGDPELASEYSELQEVLSVAHSLGDDFAEADGLREFEAPVDLEVPDLLSGVQAKIRERSQGRFYRDRFAERQKGMGWTPLILALIMALMLGVAYAGLTYVEVQAAPQSE